MDQTDIYVKMSDCPEIQDLRNAVIHDYWTHSYSPGDVYYDVSTGKVELQKYRSAHSADIWLPYQHQLQEMLVGKWLTVEVFGRFLRWFGVKEPMMRTAAGGANPFITGEQLWLAFVMKEKHGKTWDGQGWVCID